MMDKNEVPKNYESIHLGENGLEPKRTVYKVYKRRFYIITIFSIYTIFEFCVLNIWAPISESAEIAFGWDTRILIILSWLGFFTGLISLFPMMYVVKKYGLRIATLHCTFCMTIATGIRCIPCSKFYKIITCSICAVLAGYCYSLYCVAFTTLSAVWFPPNERTKATAFTSICGSCVAAAFSFLLPKLFINDSFINEYRNDNDSSSMAPDQIRKEILELLYFEFGAFVVLLITIFAYFPKEPPTPVSASADIRRVDFKNSFRQLLKSKTFWIILLAYGIPNGIRNDLVVVLDEMLKPFNVSQNTSNWIGVFMSLSAIPSSLVTSVLADYRKSMMKPLIIILTLTAGVCFLLFVLLCYGVIPRDKVAFFVILIAGSSLTNGSAPLFFEYSCEMFYPIGEEISTGLLNLFMTITSNLVLIALIVDFGGTWFAIIIAISFLIWPPFLLHLPTNYTRLQTDVNENGRS